MKNSSDTIGNRTRDLPTCSTVPQPTALRRCVVYFICGDDEYNSQSCQCRIACYTTVKELHGTIQFNRNTNRLSKCVSSVVQCHVLPRCPKISHEAKKRV